jgi:DNA-directed RNA polymerase specialized sigma24 family protein
MKLSAQAELCRLDLQTVIEDMNRYASIKLKNINIKQLEGKTPDDFTSDVLLKVLEGTRDWTIATCSMKEFLFGILRSDISHFIEKITRRDIGLFSPDDDDKEEDSETEKAIQRIIYYKGYQKKNYNK